MKYIVTYLLCSLAFGQVYTQYYTRFFTGDSLDVSPVTSGGTVLMGGAGENDNAMRWFLTQANGGDVVVLRYSGADGYNQYMFSQLGVSVNSVETIRFDQDQAAYDPSVLNSLAHAEAIWIAGGDQWDYVRGWRNTPVDSIIRQRINAGAVIGGISAGMAIQGDYYFTAENGTITSSEALQNPYDTKLTIDSSRFISAGVLNNTITDTHYDNPTRKGRHLSFMAHILSEYSSNVKGIACDEYTAVCIDSSGKAFVYGDAPNYNDFAYFIQPNCELPDYRPEVCTAGQPLTWQHQANAVKVYKINGEQTGSRYFDLARWDNGNGGSWEHWYVDNGILTVDSASGINCTAVSIQPEKSDDFVAYPIPAMSTIHVQLPNNYSSPQISITNNVGKAIDVVLENSQHEAHLDIRGLASGIYYVHIKTENRTKVLKFIKI